MRHGRIDPAADEATLDDTARVAHVHLRIVLDRRASALHRHNAMLAKRMLKRSGRSRLVGHDGKTYIAALNIAA
jgi:hypothetical protein